MGLKAGIVGLPNVGKSTLFTALTRAKAEAANYPFCTIEPNVGMVRVPDPRLDFIASVFKPKALIPAMLEFVDIAGLVAGASKGEGMGNQFLSHIRAVDAITHVVRCFEDGDITHVSGSVDPLRDIDVVDTELMLADLSTVEKRLQTSRSKARSGDKKLKEDVDRLEAIERALNEGTPVRGQGLDEPSLELIQDLHLLTAKPVLYACNVSEEDAAKGGNAFVDQVRERANKENARLVIVCAKMEAELSDMEENERGPFLEELGIKVPGLDQMIREGYALLGLMTYFTAGEKEVRAWTIHQGMKAPQAAGVIHTDFERGFIRAETYHVDDLKAAGSESAIKELGKMRSEGKEYTMKDGDICHFRFNV